MLQALGYGFLDKNQKQVCYGALGLSKLQFITTENVLPELKECTFSIACDVTNPLCGEQGCSAIFGPQKGATKKMIQDIMPGQQVNIESLNSTHKESISAIQKYLQVATENPNQLK